MGSSSVDDCYFYYYSSCIKGSDCPFRHCEAALGTETVCTLWREGLCYRANCKFRHMESRINRSSIPCYWENQPGGCRKPHCVFFHQKDRSKLNVLTETGGLILPISSQPVSPGKTVDSSVDNKRELGESHSLSPSHPIQPVVVSLGEGEESDTESTTSTPIKIISSLGKKISSPFKNASAPVSNVTSREMDLGIKTLEQIRMEKIHRESEHFYNPGETGVTDESAGSAMLEMMDCESNGYYPQEYGTAVNAFSSKNMEMELYQNASLYPMETNDVVQRSPNSQESAPGDLRHILKKKRHVPEKERMPKKPEPCTKRIISLKKYPCAFEELPEVVCVVKTRSRNEDDMGFRVKTLDEIRKEKEKKHGGKMIPLSFEAEALCEENDVEKPVINNVLDEIKGCCAEKKVKLDMDKPVIKLSCEVKKQSVENKLKPDGSKRKLCRKRLELYKAVQKERNDMEESARMLEHYATQITEDSTSGDEDASKNITQETVPSKEESQSTSSLKRACDSDVPVVSKIRKTVMLERTPVQKLSASRADEEKPLKPLTTVVANQKNDSCVTFKRRNIIRRKNFSEFSSSQSSAKSEDSSSQLQNSDSQEDLPLQTSKLSVSSMQNGACMDSDDVHEKTDVEMFDEPEKAISIVSSPSVPLECENEKGSLTVSTADEFDTLFLDTESDICIDETGGNSVPKAEDLFLEFEKIIQS